MQHTKRALLYSRRKSPTIVDTDSTSQLTPHTTQETTLNSTNSLLKPDKLGSPSILEQSQSLSKTPIPTKENTSNVPSTPSPIHSTSYHLTQSPSCSGPVSGGDLVAHTSKQPPSPLHSKQNPPACHLRSLGEHSTPSQTIRMELPVVRPSIPPSTETTPLPIDLFASYASIPPQDYSQTTLGGQLRSGFRSIPDVHQFNARFSPSAIPLSTSSSATTHHQYSTALLTLLDDASTPSSPDSVLRPLATRLQQRLREGSSKFLSRLDSLSEPLFLRALQTYHLFIYAAYCRYEQLVHHKVIPRFLPTSPRVPPSLLQSSSTTLGDTSSMLSGLKKQLRSRSSAMSSSSMTSSRRKTMPTTLSPLSQALLFAMVPTLGHLDQLVKVIKSSLTKSSIPLLKRTATSSASSSLRSPSISDVTASTSKNAAAASRRRSLHSSAVVSTLGPPASTSGGVDNDTMFRQHGFLPLIHASTQANYHILVPTDNILPRFPPCDPVNIPQAHTYTAPPANIKKLVGSDRCDPSAHDVLRQQYPGVGQPQHPYPHVGVISSRSIPHHSHILSSLTRSSLSNPSNPTLLQLEHPHPHPPLHPHTRQSCLPPLVVDRGKDTSMACFSGMSCGEGIAQGDNPPLKRKYIKLHDPSTTLGSGGGDGFNSTTSTTTTTAATPAAPRSAKYRRTLMGRLDPLSETFHPDTASGGGSGVGAGDSGLPPMYSHVVDHPQPDPTGTSPPDTIPVVEILGKGFMIHNELSHSTPGTTEVLMVQFQNNHAQILGEHAHINLITPLSHLPASPKID